MQSQLEPSRSSSRLPSHLLGCRGCQQAIYRRPAGRGCQPKVAFVAVMRKLVTFAKALL